MPTLLKRRGNQGGRVLCTSLHCTGDAPVRQQRFTVSATRADFHCNSHEPVGLIPEFVSVVDI